MLRLPLYTRARARERYKRFWVYGIFAGLTFLTSTASYSQVRYYLHSRDVSEENATYNPMVPGALPEGDTATLGTDNSATNFTGPPCEAAGFDLDTVARVNEETANAERCVATFYSPIFGADATFSTSDLSSINYSLWALEDGNATTPHLRARLYEYVESDGTYNLISISTSAAVTNAAVTNYSWSTTPDNTVTVDAGNRLALVLTLSLGTGPDTSGGTDTIDVHFDRPVTAPAYVELSSVTASTAYPAVIRSAGDDDFNRIASCAATCDGTTITSSQTWTIETSGASTTESVYISSTGIGTEGYLSLQDVKTAAVAGTNLTAYTYLYQAAPTRDGDISVSVLTPDNRTATTDPRNLAGIVLRFSSDTNFLILGTYFDGTNHVVRASNNGTATGTADTITGSANNIQLRWTKSGDNYQAKYCQPNTTDCTVDGNWTDLGTAISKAGSTLDRVGPVVQVRYTAGTNTQFGAAFDWFTIHTLPPDPVADLLVEAVSGSTTTLRLSWTAPGDDGTSGDLEAGSQFAIHYATYSAPWSEDDAEDAVTNSSHVYLSTDTAAGTAQTYMLSGLTNGTTYFVTVWTMDPEGNWSTVSNEVVQQVTYDQVRTWSGTGGNNLWSNESNWLPVGTPRDSDHVRFDGTGTASVTLDVASVISSLTVTGQYTGTLTSNNSLTIANEVNLSGGQFSMGTSSWTVGGNWTNTGGLFSVGTSTVVFRGSSSAGTLQAGPGQFYNLAFDGGGWSTTGSSITVTNLLKVQSGTFTLVNVSSSLVQGTVDVQAGGVWVIASSISVNGGTLRNSGIIRSGPGVASLSLRGTGNLGGSGSSQFPALVIDGQATLSGPIHALGALRITPASSLDANASGNYALSLSSSFVNAGTYLTRSSSITLVGSNAGLVLNSGNAPIYALRIDGAGAWQTLSSPLSVLTDLTVHIGTFTVAAGSSLTVSGIADVHAGGVFVLDENTSITGTSLTNAGTVMTSNPSAVLRLPGSMSIGGAGTTILPTVQLSGSGQTTTLAGAVTVQGDMNNAAAHTLDANSGGPYALSVGGSWLNSGTYLARANTVSFIGSGTSSTIQTNGSTFENVVFNGAGAWTTAISPIQVQGGMTVTAGTLSIVGVATVTVQGTLSVGAVGQLNIQSDLSVNSGSLLNSGTISALSTATVRLVGNGSLGGTGTTVLPRLILSGNALTTTLEGAVTVLGQLTNPSGHILDANDSGSYTLTISSDFINSGTFQPQIGTVVFNATTTLTGATSFYNLTDTTPGSVLYLPAGSTITVQNTLTLAGSSVNKILLRSATPGATTYLNVSPTGNYSITTIDVKDNTASGQTLNASASVDSGNNVNWTFGATRIWVGPGNWSTASNWNPSGVPGASDSVIFNNSNDCTIDITTTVALVALQGSYSGTITASQNLTITGGFTQAGGTFSLGSRTLSVGSNITLTGGSFASGTGTLVLTAAATGRSVQTSGQPLYNVTFNGAGYWTLTDSMTVISSITLTAGTLDTSASNLGISVGAEWLNTGGTFVGNESTILFNGSRSGSRIDPRFNSFYQLNFAGSGSWQTSGHALAVSSNVVINSGALTVASGSTVTVAGLVDVKTGATLVLNADAGMAGLSNEGSVTSSVSTQLTLTGSGPLGGTGSTRLPNLQMRSAGTTTMGGPVLVQGSFSNLSGHTLNVTASNYSLTVSSSWSNAGTFSAQNGSVTFNGSSTGLTIDPGSSNFSRLVFEGNGAYATANSPVTISSSVFLNSGSFTVASGSTLTVAGGIDVRAGAVLALNAATGIQGGSLTNAGTVTSNSATVLSLSGDGQLGGAGSTTLGILSLSGAAQTTTLGGAVLVQGGLVNGAGHTLDVDSSGDYAITVSSSWSNSGIFSAQAGSVTFTGSTSGLLVQPGSSPFYRIYFAGSGAYGTAGGAVNVSSAVWVNAGAFTVNAGSTLTVTGSMAVASGATVTLSADASLNGGSLSNAGTVSSGSGATLRLAGGGTLGGSGTTALGILSLSGAATTTLLGGPVSLQGTMTNASGHTLDVSGSNHALTVGGSWSNSGLFSSRQGNVSFSGSAGGLTIASPSPFYNITFDGGGSYSTAVQAVTVSSAVRVNAGSFTVEAGSSLTVAGGLHVALGASLLINNHLALDGGALLNAGTVSSVITATVTVRGNGTLGGAGSTTLPFVHLSGAGQTTMLGGALSVLGTLSNASSHTLDVDAAAHYQLTLSSGWANSGTFEPRSGTVVFIGSGTISGNTTFNNFSAITPGSVLLFVAGSTQTVSGALSLNGGISEYVTLRSGTSGSQFYLRSLGTTDILYVDVKDSKATGSTLNASASTDSGNNTNWTFGTTRVWDGSSSTAWATAANWTPSGAPGPLDSVYFDGLAARNCVVVSATVAQVVIRSTFTRVISFAAGAKLNVTGSFSQAAGTFTLGSAPLTVGGSLNLTGGLFNVTVGSLTFTANNAQTVRTSGRRFMSVGFSGTGGYWVMQDSMTVSSMTITAGTLDSNSSGNYGLTVEDNWINTGGTFVGNASTVSFNTSVAARSLTPNGSSFGHVTFNGSGGWLLTDSLNVTDLTMTGGTLDTYNLANPPITINGNASWSGGTINLNASSITVRGGWSRSGTSFDLGTSTVAFTSPSAKTIQSGGQSFYNLTFDGVGPWTTSGSSVTVDGSFSIQAGTVVVANVPGSTLSGTVVVGTQGTLVIDSDIAITAGSLSNAGTVRTNNSTATLVLSGTGLLGGSGLTSVPSVTLSGAGQTTTLAGPLTVGTTLYVAANHAFTPGAQLITLRGRGTPFVVSGSWTPAGSTVTYSPSGSGATVTVASTTFSTAWFNGTGNSFALSGAMFVSNLSVLAGALDVTGAHWPITVTGDWSNSGTFVAQAGSVTFNSSTGSRTINPGVSPFYKLVFAGGTYSSSANAITASSAVYVNAGTFVVASGSTLTVAGGLDVRPSATLDLQSDTLIQGGTLSNAGTVSSLSSVVLTVSGTGSLGGSGITKVGALSLTGNAQTTTLLGHLHVQGLLSNASGHTLDANASGHYGITLSSSMSNAGTYSAQASSLTLAGSASGLTLATGSSQVYKLLMTGGGSYSTAGGAVTVSSTLVVNAGSFEVASGSTMTVLDSVDVRTGATLAINADMAVAGGSFTNLGTVSSSPQATVTLSGTGSFGGTGTASWPRVTFSGSGTTTLAGPETFAGVLTIGSSHTLDANGATPYDLTISSGWVNSGTFVPRTAQVAFTANLTIQGNTTFNDFLATTPGITLTFQQGSTQTVNGTLTLTGASGNTIKLRSSVTLQQFFLNSTGAASISFVNVQDSNASGNTLNASASTNSGNNTNWTFGTTYIWIGPGNFSLATNWSPNGNPGPVDSVRYNNAASCTVDISTTITRVTIDASYSGTITAAQDLTLLAGLSQAGGTLNLANTRLTVGASWSQTGGSFQAATSTVVFNNTSGGQTIATNGQPFYNVVFNGSGGYWTMQDSMTVVSSMTLTAGTLDASGSSFGLLVGRGWINQGGVFVANNSTVTFSAAAGSRVIYSAGQPFGHIVFTGGATWIPRSDPLTVTGNITLSNNATFVSAFGSSVTASGLSIQSGSSFTMGADAHLGSLVNNGNYTGLSTTTLTLAGAGTLGGSSPTVLPRVLFTGAGATTLGGRIWIGGETSIGSGHTLDTSASNYAITVSSSWANSGTFVAQAGSVTFNGSSTGLTINPGSSSFYQMVFTGSGAYATASNPVTVSSAAFVNAGSFTVSSGSSLTVAGGMDVRAGATLLLNADAAVQGGTLSNAGAVTGLDSTVFTLSGGGQLGGSGQTILGTLTTSGAGQTTLAGPLHLLGSLDNGTSHGLDVSGSNYALTISSSFTNAGTYTAQAGSITFIGTHAGLRVNPGSSLLYKVDFAGSGSYSTFGSPVTISSTAFVTAGTFTVSAGSSLTVVGGLQVGSGAVLSLDGNTSIQGGSLTNAGTVVADVASTLLLSGEGVLGGSGGTQLGALTLSGNAQTTTLAGSVALRGGFTNNSGHTLDASGSNYALTIGGSWLNAGTYTAQSSSVTFNGTSGGLTINPGSSSFYKIIVDATSGSYATDTNPVTVSSAVYVNSGSFSVASGSTLTVAGGISVLTGATFNIDADLGISGGNLTNAGTVTSVTGATVTLSGSGTLGGPGNTQLPYLTLVAGAHTTTLGGQVTVQGALTNNSNHVLDADAAGNYQLTVSSSWANGGTFNARAATVIFSGTGTITGNTTFYNFTTLTPGITLIFQASSTQAVTGALLINGASGSPINLLSTSGTQFCLRSVGTADILYVTVSNSKATGNTLNASASTNGGNTTNWTFGTSRVWVGTTNSSWNVATNWNPSGVPSGLDSIVFNNTAVRLCNVNFSTTVAQVTIQSNFVRQIYVYNPLIINGGVSQSSGAFVLRGTTITVGGSWTNSGGSFLVPSSGTVIFNANTSGQTITSRGQSFYHVEFAGAGGYWTIQDSMTVVSSMTLVAGTLDTKAGSNNGIFVGHDWLNTGGTFIANSSTVTFTGSNAGHRIQSRGFAFGNVTVTGAGSWTLQDPLVTTGLTLSAGTLDSNASGNHAISLNGSLNFNGGTLTLNASSMSVTGDWNRSGGTFNLGTSTVAFTGVSGSTSSLTGSTTFYNLVCVIPANVLRFQSAVAQAVNGHLTLMGSSGNRIQLRSTAEPITWFFNALGTHSIGYVDVKNSNARGGNTLFAGKTSNDSGSNLNWIFNYKPDAVTDLLAIPLPDGSLQLSWSVPLDADDNPFTAGSQYAIEWATYTVVSSTSNTNDTGYWHRYHLYQSTEAVTAGSPQVLTVPGLTGGIDYGLRLWTMDPQGLWSSVSNISSATVNTILSVTLSNANYGFGSVRMGAIAVSSTAVTVTNSGNVTQSYSLSVSTSGPTTVWSVASSTPSTLDQFGMFAKFGSVAPSSTTFSAADMLTGTPKPSTVSTFATDQTGIVTSTSSARDLWLRLDMPLKTSTKNQQQMQVTVTATTP